MAKFEVQARVLDLLGKDQIADTPTAISELFKNAYDAYATEAFLDVYPDQDLAIVSDNGVGMSEDVVIKRWLVIGTSDKRDVIEPPKGEKHRIIMGEKGIGRLAISTIGDTLLMITKTRNAKYPYTALLINWSIVKNNRLLLSDINIPVLPLESIEELESGILAKMVEAVRNSISVHEEDGLFKGFENTRASMLDQLQHFKLNIDAIKRTGIESNQSGTIFYIADLNPDIRSFVRGQSRNDPQGNEMNLELVQLLGNFVNRFRSETDIQFSADVRFWDDDINDLKSAFDAWDSISPEDVDLHDHYFDIHFDENGIYTGTMNIFGEEVALPPPAEQRPGNVECGPFDVRLWYVQGRRKESTLSDEHFSLMENKLGKFGGLMLYRDDIRVLSYGKPEIDWLKFEERRSKGAWRYFFSYRRMFGFVAITNENNPKLRDKAGREGLIANKAYRDLRNTLIGFFVDIADRYFTKKSDFINQKKVIAAHKIVLDAQDKRAEEKREKLIKSLRGKINYIDQVEKMLTKLYDSSISGLSNVKDGDPEELLVRVEKFTQKLTGMEEKARCIIPEEFLLPDDTDIITLKHDYEQKWPVFKNETDKLLRKFEDEINTRFEGIKASEARAKEIREAYDEAQGRVTSEFALLRADADKMTEFIIANCMKVQEKAFARIDDILLSLTSSKEITDAFTSGRGDFGSVLAGMQRASHESATHIEDLKLRLHSYIEGFFEEQRDILPDLQSGIITNLKEDLTKNLDLVQLGLSVEIIDHDLNKLYGGMKAKFKELNRKFSKDALLVEYLSVLEANFQHIEQRYKLMSPLYRGSYRRKKEIDGKQILKYLNDFLHHQLDVSGVSIEASNRFKSFTVNEAPAVILPVFVNIVDNSIYWIRKRDEDKLVKLDCVNDVLTINDSGSGIHETILDKIFDSFFTKKPGGRGLGLYIARANLERYNHEIWATNDPPYKDSSLTGACICIKFNEKAIVR